MYLPLGNANDEKRKNPNVQKQERKRTKKAKKAKRTRCYLYTFVSSHVQESDIFLKIRRKHISRFSITKYFLIFNKILQKGRRAEIIIFI